MARVLRYAAVAGVATILVAAFAFFVLEIPLPWKTANAEAPPLRPRAIPSGIELVAGQPHTLAVPEAVRLALGIRKGGKDLVAVAVAPKQVRPLVLPGSTALDPARIMRIRARFAPAEVVKIGEVNDPLRHTAGFDLPSPELRPGDEVKQGQELGIFFSADVGNKKNDLFEAVVQLRLDQIILDRAEKAGGSLPEIYLWNARRNVDTDRSAVRRAKNTLKTWNIDDADISSVEKEALQLSLTEGKRENYKEAEWAEKHNQWARVLLKAPDDGILIERNVTKGEMVVDNTINLFTLAKVDRLLVVANCPEDDIPKLQSLKPHERRWTVHTVGATPGQGVEASIDEIGWIIDPNQHTAIIKGYINNPDKTVRAGQFVSATINLPPPKGVVEVPIDAVVEDGQQCVVFVQRDPTKASYTMRRVQVTHRFDKSAFVRSTPIPENERITLEEKDLGMLPKEPLQPGERILEKGVGELKAALLDKESEVNKDRTTKQ
jgi:cobalt-zinc-cadmium efflux system membrane fusion protein